MGEEVGGYVGAQGGVRGYACDYDGSRRRSGHGGRLIAVVEILPCVRVDNLMPRFLICTVLFKSFVKMT